MKKSFSNSSGHTSTIYCQDRQKDILHLKQKKSNNNDNNDEFNLNIMTPSGEKKISSVI